MLACGESCRICNWCKDAHSFIVSVYPLAFLYSNFFFLSSSVGFVLCNVEKVQVERSLV